ncbi:MAG: hypothetical protein JWM20_877 [Patescibacteria group bacterium]|nr:hypothetical protein [Patescibacteria group bacterium]
MKKSLSLFVLALAGGIFFSSCSNNANSSSYQSSTVALDTPPTISPIPQEHDRAKLFQRMSAARRCALRLLEEYKRDSALNPQIETVVKYATFYNGEMLPGSTNMVYHPLDSFRTPMMVVAVDPSGIATVKGSDASAVLMLTVGPFKTDMSPQSMSILINRQLLFEFDTLYLGSALIHEAIHVLQGPNRASMGDLEFEPYAIQTRILKHHLSVEQKKIYELHLAAQKKLPYNVAQLDKDNSGWITEVFGSANGYIDKFGFDVYGSRWYTH